MFFLLYSFVNSKYIPRKIKENEKREQVILKLQLKEATLQFTDSSENMVEISWESDDVIAGIT